MFFILNILLLFAVQIPKIVVVNITHITTTHALCTWQRITDDNKTYGAVAGYKVSFTHNQRSGMELDVSSSQSNVYLVDLFPNTSYGVIVFGYNHYGDGVISDVYNFTTKGMLIVSLIEVTGNERCHLFWMAVTQHDACTQQNFAILERKFFSYACVCDQEN